jgi:hypothetical protein
MLLICGIFLINSANPQAVEILEQLLLRQVMQIDHSIQSLCGEIPKYRIHKMLLSVGGLVGEQHIKRAKRRRLHKISDPAKKYKLRYITNPSILLTSLHGLFSLTFRRHISDITLQTHRLGGSDICNSVFPGK